jgi:hypothetical protein
MANEKISAMSTAAAPLTGTELIPLVQDGGNVKATLSAFGQYAIDTFQSYGAFQDLGADQTAAANAVTLLRIDTTDFTQGVTRAGSRITLTNAGVYSITISLQLINTTANYDSFTLWPVINGVSPAGSASIVNVPEKKGGIDGLTILAVQYTYQFAADEFFEFNWHNVAGHSKVATLPASLTTPIHPAAAGVILSVIQVG